MNWSMRNGTITCAPYSIIQETRGMYSVWYKAGDKFGILKRDVPTLETAQKLCESHKATEANRI